MINDCSKCTVHGAQFTVNVDFLEVNMHSKMILQYYINLMKKHVNSLLKKSTCFFIIIILFVLPK